MDNVKLLEKKMIEYEGENTARIHHFLKVLSFAELIGDCENIDDETMYILKSAAVLHDIGIKKSLEKYSSSSGKYQQIEGPELAYPMLEQLGYDQVEINRICYLIAHHHTYCGIDGVDYQILVEADFLVNVYEEEITRENAQNVYDNVFKTSSGKEIFKTMYLS